MKSTAKPAGGNSVVQDRQWVRRVQQEEINMIDSFSGNKLATINRARDLQQKNHFYPQHKRMAQPAAMQAQAAGQREETKSMASRARDSDGLDSVSQVSVTTPKSFARSSQRGGDSVSYVSVQTKTTTVSTKEKLAALEHELNKERELRLQMEQRIAALSQKNK